MSSDARMAGKQRDIAAFVEFLRGKFATGGTSSKFFDNHDIAWSDELQLLYHGCPDTGGYGSVHVDYTELLERIDEFAAEFLVAEFSKGTHETGKPQENHG